jgi:predicted site-specific integrase-resolvase
MAVQHFNQVELSRRWRLSPRTLERWRFQGTGPQYLKVGGRVIYRLEDVETYEAGQLQAAGAAKVSRPTAPLRLVRA